LRKMMAWLTVQKINLSLMEFHVYYAPHKSLCLICSLDCVRFAIKVQSTIVSITNASQQLETLWLKSQLYKRWLQEYSLHEVEHVWNEKWILIFY
jgi:hypothetical protein